MDNTIFNIDYYFDQKFLSSEGDKNPHALEYMSQHKRRFEKNIDFLDGITGESALEIGATDFFQIYIQKTMHFIETWASIFTDDICKKLYNTTFQVGEFETKSRAVSINLESEFFPVSGAKFDLVMLCEVIEHFDVDPMFALNEINRVTKLGGKLLVTTPNACSARNAYKACLGYRPHFFMQYQKNRDPYRHNFEHDIHSLTSLIEGAGYRLIRVETHDVFDITDEEAVKFLKKNQMPMNFRGDDIFILAEKISDPVTRWPEGVYV